MEEKKTRERKLDKWEEENGKEIQKEKLLNSKAQDAE